MEIKHVNKTAESTGFQNIGVGGHKIPYTPKTYAQVSAERERERNVTPDVTLDKVEDDRKET
jgi:hypothetical protein